MHLTRLAALALLTAAAPVFADEVWYTTAGEIVYRSDIDFTAVLTVPQDLILSEPGAKPVHLYVEGLPGNVDGRGYMTGYWISPNDVEWARCSTKLAGPDGMVSGVWGRAVVIFDQVSFPSGFTLLSGGCFSDPYFAVRAELNDPF